MKGLSGVLYTQQDLPLKSLFQSSNCNRRFQRPYPHCSSAHVWNWVTLDIDCSQPTGVCLQHSGLISSGYILKNQDASFFKCLCMPLLYALPAGFLLEIFLSPPSQTPKLSNELRKCLMGGLFPLLPTGLHHVPHNPGQELVKLLGYFWGNLFNYTERILSHTAKSSSAQGWCKHIQETCDAKTLRLWRKYFQVDMAANWSEFSSLGSVPLAASIPSWRRPTQRKTWLHWSGIRTEHVGMGWNAASQTRAEGSNIFPHFLCQEGPQGKLMRLRRWKMPGFCTDEAG